MMEFRCPACDRTVTVKDDQANRSIPCPSCGAALTVPAASPSPPGPPHATTIRQKHSPNLAIAALVLGIVSLLMFALVVKGRMSPWSALSLAPLVGLVGLALGIFALARRRFGKGIAIAGVAAGLVGTLLMPLHFAYYFVWCPSLSEGRSALARRGICMTQLKNIGLGVEMYKNANRQQPPANLEMLVSQGHLSRKMLKCPSSTSLSDVDYFYYPRPDGSPSSAIVACDTKDNHGGDGRNVLYADSYVKWLSESAFQAELSKPVNAAFAKALAQAEITAHVWMTTEDTAFSPTMPVTTSHPRKE